jgi:hypothetical protein
MLHPAEAMAASNLSGWPVTASELAAEMDGQT